MVYGLFQFFPSCSNGGGSLPALSDIQHFFQFFPSCSRGLRRAPRRRN